jgi:uncharacterized protein YjbJ (UPF0337 family)
MKALPWIVAGIGLGLAIAYVILNEPDLQAETGWDSVENSADKVWRWGSKNRLSGAGSSVAGRFKQGLGRIVGDGDLADEGAVDQALGSVQNAAGKVAHAAAETIHDLNR